MESNEGEVGTSIKYYGCESEHVFIATLRGKMVGISRAREVKTKKGSYVYFYGAESFIRKIGVWKKLLEYRLNLFNGVKIKTVCIKPIERVFLSYNFVKVRETKKYSYMEREALC